MPESFYRPPRYSEREQAGHIHVRWRDGKPVCFEPPPCSHCGQAFDPQRDIRIVNGKRGYVLPEPKHCPICWQVGQQALDPLPSAADLDRQAEEQRLADETAKPPETLFDLAVRITRQHAANVTKILLVSALLVCAHLAESQETAQQSKFWTEGQIIGQTANLGIRLTDAIRTCQLPGRETMAPFQSCAGTTVWILGGVPASIGTAYLLHRTHHNKLARIVPWLYFSTDSYAVGYSFQKAWPNRFARGKR